MEARAGRRGARQDFIRPGGSVRDDQEERFSGQLRDECLGADLFSDLVAVGEKLESWRHDYNTLRLHGSLGHLLESIG
jgi:putative transposase